MSKELSPLKLNELYFQIQQVTLYKITPSILSISFEVLDGKIVSIKIYKLKNDNQYEMECIKKIHNELALRLESEFQISFEIKELNEYKDILEMKTLKYKFYLTNKFATYSRGKYDC